MIINKKYFFILLVFSVVLTSISVSFASEISAVDDSTVIGDSQVTSNDIGTIKEDINYNNNEKDNVNVVNDKLNDEKTIKKEGQKSTGIAFSKSYRNANQTVEITAILRSGGVGLSGEILTISYNGVAKRYTTGNDGSVKQTYNVTQPGTQTIIMEYAGSDVYKSSNRTETFQRVPSNPLILIKLNTTSVHVGDVITISTQLTERDSTPIANEKLNLTLNNVTYNNKVTDKNGYVNITYNVTKPLNNTFTVVHQESDYYAYQENYRTFVSNRWGTSDLIWKHYSTDNYTLEARITLYSNEHTVSGEKFRLALNGNETEVYTDKNGVATAVFKLQDRGDQTLYIWFDETDMYMPHNRSVTISSYKYNTTLQTTVSNTAKVGEVLPITAQLNYTTVDDNNNVNYSSKLSNEPVTISVNNENFTGKTDSKGQFTINYTPTTAGTLNVISYYNQGQFKFNISQSRKTNVNVEGDTNPRAIIVGVNAPKTMVTGQTAKLNVTVTDKNKKSVNSSVILKVNGLTQKNKDGSVLIIDVKNGKASYNLPLAGYSAKEYNITAVTVDKSHDRTENSTIMTVIRGKCKFSPITINASSEEEISIVATVKDAYGNVITGNTQIAIKLGDRTVLTTRITDGKINVKVKVPYLPPGENKFRIILGENYRYEQNIINNTLNIHKQNVTATISKITSQAGKKITIKTTLINQETKTNVIGGKFSYKLDGQTISTDSNAQVSNAIAQLEYTLPSTIKTGKHTIMIVYAGNTQSNPIRYSSDALTIT